MGSISFTSPSRMVPVWWRALQFTTPMSELSRTISPSPSRPNRDFNASQVIFSKARDIAEHELPVVEFEGVRMPRLGYADRRASRD